MALQLLRKFVRSERGGIYVYFVLALLPLIAFIGLSVDMSRAYLGRSILTSVTDAAAMAAAKVDPENAKAEAQRVFNAVIKDTSIADTAHLDAVIVDKKRQFVEVKASSSVSLSFLKVVGYGSLDVHGTSKVLRSGRAIEVALVLDNTGSMKSKIGGRSRMDLLKDSARLFVETVIPEDEGSEILHVSVVPYVTQVNVGVRPEWLTHAGKILITKKNKFPKKPYGQWMGCVEARLSKGLHQSDTPPTTEDTRFNPYWWPSTWKFKYPYPKGTIRPWGKKKKGDNDWKNKTITATDVYRPLGPNAGCPAEIQPLTNIKSSLLKRIDQMQPIGRGGTHIFTGLKAGWWTLSPSWRGLWNTKASLPADSGDSKKIVILMSDGENYWLGSDAPQSLYKDKHYTAYGRWYGSTHKAQNQSVVTPTSMNSYTLEICNEMKNRGVTIYTVTFGVKDREAEKMMEACATSLQHYFDTDSAHELKSAFVQIGTEISELRYSWPKSNK